MPTQRTPPWQKPGPVEDVPLANARTTLTPANLTWAKMRARKAGRRYPNLIDNMAAAYRQKAKGAVPTAHARNLERPEIPRGGCGQVD